MGYVTLVDVMPQFVPTGRTGDVAVAEGARVSYGAAEGRSELSDSRLIRYLVEHWHTSPLEMAEVKFQIRAPLFVIAQLIRHRTANVNSQSRRYTNVPDEFYQPPMRMQHAVNKQSSVDLDPTDPQTKCLLASYRAMEDAAGNIHELYDDLVAQGVAREVARCALPQSAMSSIVWKCDLHNFLKMCNLRRATEAQKEIRDLADAMFTLVKPLFPVTCNAVEEFWTNSVSLSETEIELIANKCGADSDQAKVKLGKRARAVYQNKLNSMGLSFE